MGALTGTGSPGHHQDQCGNDHEWEDHSNGDEYHDILLILTIFFLFQFEC